MKETANYDYILKITNSRSENNKNYIDSSELRNKLNELIQIKKAVKKPPLKLTFYITF
jgi:hypothetical protein